MNKKFGAFSSSVDSSSLSARVTGVIISTSGMVVLFLAHYTQIPMLITPDEINSSAKQIGDLVGIAVTFYGVAHSLFGFFRSVISRYTKKD